MKILISLQFEFALGPHLGERGLGVPDKDLVQYQGDACRSGQPAAGWSCTLA
jgi:hypothetical protein